MRISNLTMHSQILLLMSLLCCVASIELYSSVAHLKQSFDFISSLNATKTLQSFITRKEKQLGLIEQVVGNLKELSEEIKDPEFDLQHPLNAYRFIRNHSLVFNSTMEQLFGMIGAYERDAFNVTQLKTAIKNMPNQTDMEEIVNGIFRIQDVYELTAKELVFEQKLFDSSDLITAQQCYYISERALILEEFVYALDWINLGVYLVSEMNDTTVPLYLLLEDASVIAFTAGNVKKAMLILKELFKIKPSDRMARKLYRQYEITYSTKSVEQKRAMAGIATERPTKTATDAHADMLCQGKGDQIKKQAGQKQHTLSCRYQTNNHPLLLFRPGQLEEVSRKPYIVVYHNFLLKPEIVPLMEFVRPRLKRSKYLKTKDEFTVDATRVSKTGYIYNHPVKDSADRRIEALTGSSLDWSESFQVTNYGIGGGYETHSDYLPQSMVDKHPGRQRQSTFMIYFSDVYAGGATIFPRINETIYPEAGKAVFWYNTFRNGLGDPLTYHAACPVIVGDKWISNQWIQLDGNEFLRPCSLKEHE